jgi:hypothetical protein
LRTYTHKATDVAVRLQELFTGWRQDGSSTRICRNRQNDTVQVLERGARDALAHQRHCAVVLTQLINRQQAVANLPNANNKIKQVKSLYAADIINQSKSQLTTTLSAKNEEQHSCKRHARYHFATRNTKVGEHKAGAIAQLEVVAQHERLDMLGFS